MATVILALMIAPVLYIIYGVVLRFFPPKNINDFIGFRTKHSKKTPHHWAYAQKIAGCYLVILGVILSLLSSIYLIYLYHTNFESWYFIVPVILIQLLSLVGIIVFVEYKLKGFKPPSIRDQINESDIIE